MLNRKYFSWITLAGLIGIVSAFWQLSEKLTLLKNTTAPLSCNYNSVFSCSNVLNAHQSSILGPPNSVIGIAMFSFFLTIGLVGLTGSKLSKAMAYFVQLMALFMLGFTLWFLFESTFRIHSICIFCLFIGTSILVINAAIFRYNSQFNRTMKNMANRGLDLFVWSLLWLVVAFLMTLKFA